MCRRDAQLSNQLFCSAVHIERLASSGSYEGREDLGRREEAESWRLTRIHLIQGMIDMDKGERQTGTENCRCEGRKEAAALGDEMILSRSLSSWL